MTFNFPPFSIAFFCAGASGLYFTHTVFKRRVVPGALPFSIFLLAATFWTVAYGLEVGATEYATKILWAKMEYFGILTTGVMWFCFSFDYTGSTWWRRPKNLLLLSLLPIITLIIVWTNDWQGWYWSHIYVPAGISSPFLVYEHGPWFWVAMVYQYSLFIAGIIILWRFGLRRSRLYRQQVITLIIGTLIPTAGILVFLLFRAPVAWMDLTPFAFLLAGLAYSITIFRFHFPDVIPAARNALVDNMPDGILVLSADGVIADINPAARRIIGLEKGSAVGKRLDQIYPKLDLLLSNLEPGRHTELMSENSGSRLFLDISLTILRDRREAVTGQLVILRDITEYRKMEQTLRESESRYKTLVEQSNEGVLIIQDGVYKFANRTMAEITGYSVDELAGKKMPFAIADEDKNLINERYNQRIEGKKVPNVYGVLGVRKDGVEREIEISVDIIFYEGKLAHLATIRDVTELKLTQRKLETLYNEERRLSGSLQEEIEKRTKYTRALVHELRTPLTSILASSELLESEIVDGIHSSLVKNIRRASLNLEQRINELIDLARGEIGMLKINPSQLDMSQLLKDIASEMSPVLTGKGLTLVTEIPDLPPVCGDSSRLRQIMTNLLSNAIKFTTKGAIEIKADYNDNDAVLVQVKDTGRGISKKQLEYLFDPYRRKNDEKHELSGLGIGLVLSKMYVELHRGKIWAESTPGTGSTFSFTVPIYKIIEKPETRTGDPGQ